MQQHGTAKESQMRLKLQSLYQSQKWFLACLVRRAAHAAKSVCYPVIRALQREVLCLGLCCLLSRSASGFQGV
jgi:hypothetical protein